MSNKRVLELIRVTNMGQGNAELLAEEICKDNSFEPVSASKIQELFFALRIPLLPIKGHSYYVYYNYHSSSGFKTVLYINDEGQLAFKVERPQGGVLCAFWSEIVIFSLLEGF
jgi:hypothetical protein